MRTIFSTFLPIAILSSIALLFGGQARACKLTPEAYDLDAFMNSDHPNKVVFQGKVVSIKADAPTKDGEQVQVIHFKSDQWWVGQAREKLTARGVKGSAFGTSCEGVFDFTAKNGEVWLIAGYEESGIIYPSPQLSLLLANGRIPPDAQRVLQTKRVRSGHLRR